jgi:hypothetical protein
MFNDLVVERFKAAMVKNTPTESFNIASQAVTTAAIAALQGLQKVAILIGCLFIMTGELLRVLISGAGQWLVAVGQYPLLSLNSEEATEDAPASKYANATGLKA